MTAEVIEFPKDDRDVIIFDLHKGETIVSRFRLDNTWDDVEAFLTSKGRLFYVLHEWEHYDPILAEKIA